MFIFRGQRIDNKEWIEGSFIDIDLFKGILPLGETQTIGVHPETLSVSAGVLDKNNNMIFSSFEIDGKITEGGDTIQYTNSFGDKKDVDGKKMIYPVVFSDGYFGTKDEDGDVLLLCSYETNQIKIIGKQCDKE